MGHAAARRAQRPAADHLRGGRRRARRHQGLGAGHRLGAGRAGPCGRSSCRTRCSASFNPFAEEIDGDWIVYPEQRPPRSTSATCISTGAASTRCRACAEVSDPPLRTEVLDDWTGTADRVRDPEQTRHVWYAEVGDRRDDDLGELPGRRPERGARRDQRAPLGLLSRPSTTSTTSPCAASSWRRPRARGPRRPPTSPA